MRRSRAADARTRAARVGASAGSRRPGKRYDRAYFDRWYRRSAIGIGRRDHVARKVALAVAAAEYVLARPIRSVLDVGCGEAPWRAVLRRLRPGIAYLGVDSSDYVVARYGRTRAIRKGSFGRLGELRLARHYDLVVCADVLHYLPTAEARAGLAALAPRVGGVAFIEAFTSGDEIEGDHDSFQRRSPGAYRTLFARAGLVPLGLHLYVRAATFGGLTTLERGPGRPG